MLKYLLEKEFKQFFRNKALPKMAVVMPFMAILIFPLVANFEIKNNPPKIHHVSFGGLSLKISIDFRLM